MAIHPDEQYGRPQSGGINLTTTGPDANNINPNNQVDMRRLWSSMEWSSQQLRHYRDIYVEAVEYYSGSRYPQDGLRHGRGDTKAFNMLRLAVDIWGRGLISQTPQCLIYSSSPELATDAYELELALNHLVTEINLGRTLSEVVKQAMFMMGILKVGLTSKYLSEAIGWTHDSGQPYADPILFEDWLHDMNARRQEEWDWCGHRYRLPYEVVMENPDYDQNVLRKLRPDGNQRWDDVLFSQGEYNSHQLSTNESMHRASVEYKPHVDLWDIWLPRDNLLVTVSNLPDAKPLQIREWEGPEGGPFHLLFFTSVPGNVMPNAPAQNIYELQDLLSVLFNQLANQAQRQKTLTIVDGPAESDGTGATVEEAFDGQTIRVNSIDGVKDFKTGGVDPGNMQFVIWLRDMLSYHAGNLDAMGGLAQQAGTATQERLLVESSSEMLRSMQSTVVTYTTSVMRDLGWYMYSDPTIQIPLTKRIPNYGDVRFVWGPEHREADFYEYNFKLSPYSLQAKTPAERLSTIFQIIQTIYMPLAPQFEAWGITMDMKRLTELIAKYSDLPELTDILASEWLYEGQDLAARTRQAGGERPLQSPTTSRNYTRTNVSTGGTQGARDQDMMRVLGQMAGRS